MTIYITETDQGAEIGQHAHASHWRIEIQESQLDYVIDNLIVIRDRLRAKVNESPISQ